MTARPLDMFLALLRLSLGKGTDGAYAEFAGADEGDWEEVFRLSARQGTLLLIYGGVQRLPPQMQPPRKLKLRWCANVVRGCDRYDAYRIAVGGLSRFFSENGFDMLILKGLTLARLYPVPWHREGGDVDIYMFGRARQADRLVSSRGIEVSCSIPKHSVFRFGGLTVENHHTFFDTDLRFRREAALYDRMERMLKDTFTADECFTSSDPATAGELPPQAAALYLAGHTFRHFCNIDANLRQLCDWVVFFDANRSRIDHSLLEKQLRQLGIGDFAAAVNSFCARRLGFEPAFMARDTRGAESDSRFILKTLMKYRKRSRFHIPAAAPLRRIAARNGIYGRYLGGVSPREFLLPELGNYFSYQIRRALRPANRLSHGH